MQPPKFLAKAVAGGRCAPRLRSLGVLAANRCRTTFAAIKALLGFVLPNTASTHRPCRANQANTTHSQALPSSAVGRRTCGMDLLAESPAFERLEAASSAEHGQRALAIEEVFPPHDFGPWPEGFSTSREQLYGDEGR